MSILAASLFAAQVLAGALTIWLRFPLELRALHLSLGTLLWGAMVWIISLAFVHRQASNPEPAHA